MRLSVIIRCGYDHKNLLRCIASIDEKVEVVVSMAEGSKITKKDIKRADAIVTHKYGNWSQAAEVGVQRAQFDKIVVMDADSIFARNTISQLYAELDKGYLVVKPKIIFIHNGSLVSKLISNIRTHQNEYKPKAFTPGLAMNKKKLLSMLGNSDQLYDVNIKYADDGNLNKRIYEKKIPIKILPSAKVFHDPVTLKHEIKTAYILGKGNRLGDGKLNIKSFIHKEISHGTYKFYLQAYNRFGTTTVVALIGWRIIYYFGYFFCRD